MWYVVQVETGREKTACDDIKQAAEDVLDECFVPQYLTGKRRPDALGFLRRSACSPAT